MLALERFLASVDALVFLLYDVCAFCTVDSRFCIGTVYSLYLKVMLEFKCLAALAALELSEIRPVVVVGHVSLQLGQVGKLLRADGARL